MRKNSKISAPMILIFVSIISVDFKLNCIDHSFSLSLDIFRAINCNGHTIQYPL